MGGAGKSRDDEGEVGEEKSVQVGEEGSTTDTGVEEESRDRGR